MVARLFISSFEPVMSKESTSTSKEPNGHPDVPFGANEVRLSWWQWIVVFVFVGTIVFSLPGWWVARESTVGGRGAIESAHHVGRESGGF